MLPPRRAPDLSAGVPAMMASPEVTQTGTRAAQLEAGNAYRDIESGLSLQAQRLQREGILRPAHQRVGVAPYDDRGAGSEAAIAPGEITRADVACRGEHHPSQCRLLREADIETDPPHQPIVRITRTAVRLEPALQLVHRAHDVARAPGSPAFENSGLDPRLARGRRACCGERGTCECADHRDAFHRFPSVRTVWIKRRYSNMNWREMRRSRGDRWIGLDKGAHCSCSRRNLSARC